ncbi:MAG: zf-TFIIB domain-containing protein [Phycisphaerae bacterium]|nr:zf-TFIIB domain-containing protein [Phycisphaerae bacterium]
MCPICGEPMIALELEGVEVDCCVECGGTWLDAGELEQIAELAEAPPGPLTDALGAAGEGKHGKRRCPRCRGTLRIITVGKEPAVEIDRCPRGHGLWFDRGEIKTLIREFAEGEGGVVAKFFEDLFRYELDETREGE